MKIWLLKMKFTKTLAGVTRKPRDTNSHRQEPETAHTADAQISRSASERNTMKIPTSVSYTI